MKEINLNIHNILKIKIVGSNKRYMKYFDYFFSFFKTDEKIKNPDILVKIGKFKKRLKKHFVFQGYRCKYYASKNSFYCEDRYKTVNWKLLIEGIEHGKTTIYFDGSPFGERMLRRYVLDPIIRMKMNKKGYAMIHSSGVFMNDKTVIFPSYGGVGKTSTTLNLVNRGAKFLSDDFIILSNKGIVYSYPVSICLFGYNLWGCPNLSKNLSWMKKRRINVKDAFQTMTGKMPLIPEITIPENINVGELYEEEVTRSHPLNLVISLVKSNDRKFKLKKNVKKENIINKMILVNKFEFFYFLEYMKAYTIMFPKSKLEDHWGLLYKNILKGIRKAKCHELYMSEYNFNKINKLLKQVI